MSTTPQTTGTNAPATSKKPLSTKQPYKTGDIFTPDIIDAELPRKDLYFGHLIARLISKIHYKRKVDAESYGYRHRLSWTNLSRASGVPLPTVHSHFLVRNRTIDIKTADKYLWAAKFSVLDLIHADEYVSAIESMTIEQRGNIRQCFKKALDRLDELEHNQGALTNTPGSQKPTPGE